LLQLLVPFKYIVITNPSLQIVFSVLIPFIFTGDFQSILAQKQLFFIFENEMKLTKSALIQNFFNKSDNLAGHFKKIVTNIPRKLFQILTSLIEY
jgi:hypothetical protein